MARQGRPPIGKRTMTGSERVRRYRERHRHDEILKRIERLKARIRDLEAQLRRV